MFKRTQSLQITRALQALILANKVNAAPGAELDITAKVKLIKAGPAPSIDSVIADYSANICDFTGYADKTLSAVLGPINLTANQNGMHQEMDWLASGATTPGQDAIGAIITDSAGTTLYAVEMFDTPAHFENTGDALSYDLILAPPTVWGGENG